MLLSASAGTGVVLRRSEPRSEGVPVPLLRRQRPISGEFYRLRDTRKSGLIRSPHGFCDTSYPWDHYRPIRGQSRLVRPDVLFLVHFWAVAGCGVSPSSVACSMPANEDVRAFVNGFEDSTNVTGRRLARI